MTYAYVPNNNDIHNKFRINTSLVARLDTFIIMMSDPIKNSIDDPNK